MDEGFFDSSTAFVTALVGGAELATGCKAFTSESRSVCRLFFKLSTLVTLLELKTEDGGKVFIRSLNITIKLPRTTPIALREYMLSGQLLIFPV